MVPQVLRSLVALATLAIPCLADDRPHLIFFVADDIGRDAVSIPGATNTLGCYTPHLDRLARHGVTFPWMRTDPSCSPTRAGLLTGRYAWSTGVFQVLAKSDPLRDLFALQTEEKTLAEILHDAGYHTIHVDKWHVGRNGQLRQKPRHQGFVESYPTRDYRGKDQPDFIGDEHISLMVDTAVNAVQNAPRDRPYALFFWSVDAHDRTPDADGLHWWKVDPALAPQTHAEGPPEPDDRFRYRAVVEALDTEFARLLIELGIVDSSMAYRSKQPAVVFFHGDNGTPNEVLGTNRGKGSLFEGGSACPASLSARASRRESSIRDSSATWTSSIPPPTWPRSHRTRVGRPGPTRAVLPGYSAASHGDPTSERSPSPSRRVAAAASVVLHSGSPSPTIASNCSFLHSNPRTVASTMQSSTTWLETLTSPPISSATSTHGSGPSWISSGVRSS